MFIPLKREDTVRPLVFYEAGIRENLCSERHILHKWQRTGGSGEGCRRDGKSSGFTRTGVVRAASGQSSGFTWTASGQSSGFTTGITSSRIRDSSEWSGSPEKLTIS